MKPHLILALFPLLVLLGSCRTQSPPRVEQVQPGSIGTEVAVEGSDVDVEALRQDLIGFRAEIESRLQKASDQMVEDTNDPEERDDARRWGTTVENKMLEYMGHGDLLSGFVDTWAYLASLGEPTDKPGKSNLSPHSREIAMDAANDLRENFRAIARRHMRSSLYKSTRDRVRAYAKTNPLGGEADGLQPVAPISSTAIGRDIISFLVRTPLAPFTAAERLGQGATSVKDIAGSIERFNLILEEMPEDMRMETEKLLHNLQVDDKLTSTLLTVQEVNATMQHISATADSYPDKVAATANRMMQDSVAIQPEWRATMQEAQATAASIDDALKRMDSTAVALTETAKATESAARQIESLARPPQRPGEKPSEARPFDIEDYKRTAESITGMLQELRAATDDLQNLGRSEAIEKATAEFDKSTKLAADTTAQRLNAVIDHLAARAVQVITFFFVLLVVYRFIHHRLASRASKGTT